MTGRNDYYSTLGDRGKFLAMNEAWRRLTFWVQSGEVEDGDLVLDRMRDLEDEVIRPVIHPIRTVELPPLAQEVLEQEARASRRLDGETIVIGTPDQEADMTAPSTYRILERGRGYRHLTTLAAGMRTACGRTLNPAETLAVSPAVVGVSCPMCRRTGLYRKAVAAGELQASR